MKKGIVNIIGLMVLTVLSINFIGYDNTPPPGTIEVIGNAGGDNVFTFNKWGFESFEVPDGNIELIKAVAEINTTSLTCDWKDLEKNIRSKKDYFYVKKFPTAKVVVAGAKLLDDGSYETEAMLTLKKFTKPVTLNFKVVNESPLTIEGTGTMKRQQWGFTGGGPADMVPISFTFTQPTE